MKPCHVIFMGSSDFAVPALKALNAMDDVKVDLVLTQPDRPNSRGKKIKFLPVKQTALDLGIEVYQPDNVSKEGEDRLQSLRPDLFVVAAYGQILRKNILDIPKYGSLNIHGSLLPHLRGAAPVHHAIIDGDEKSGVTIMQLDEGMDTGDMIGVCETPITDQTTAGELHNKLSEIGAKLLVELLPEYLNGSILPVKQDSKKADYADKVEKKTGEIHFGQEGKKIVRRINGTDPFPGPYGILLENGKEMKVKVFSPRFEQAKTAKPGTILEKDRKNGLLIACRDGAVRIGEIQFPGKKRMKVEDYFVGNQISDNAVFKA